MYLKYLQIVNFKNLRNVRFEFDKGVNTVTGENDSGKSNAMTAMRVLLDNDYYYNEKRLKETDFCEELGNWKGHWIIVSAFFDEITPEDKLSEVCAEIMPENEDAQFLKSYIRCRDCDYGVITVIIRPNKSVRKALFDAASTEEFNRIRDSILLKDYEFLYTARSQADFTDPTVYKEIVGDLDNCKPVNPEDDDSALIGSKVNILDIWRHVSLGENGVEIYKKVVQKVFLSMRIQVQNETSLEEAYLQFLEKAEDRIQRYGLPSECKDFFKCFEEKNGVVVNTVHGVKGEEYETVIAFGMLNGYIPHWNDIFSPDHSREITAHKLVYVLCSRAKENLYLIGEKGRKTQRGFAYSMTDEIANVSWDYD